MKGGDLFKEVDKSVKIFLPKFKFKFKFKHVLNFFVNFTELKNKARNHSLLSPIRIFNGRSNWNLIEAPKYYNE